MIRLLTAVLLSIAAGVLIIVWPSPGLVALAIVLGSWLIVSGTIAIAGSFAIRKFMPDWWLLLVIGLLEIPLGVLTAFIGAPFFIWVLAASRRGWS